MLVKFFYDWLRAIFQKQGMSDHPQVLFNRKERDERKEGAQRFDGAKVFGMPGVVGVCMKPKLLRTFNSATSSI